MESTKKLHAGISDEIKTKIDLFLTNTNLTKKEQEELINTFNALYYSLSLEKDLPF